MSALGQMQTHAVQKVMSALPPIADIEAAAARTRRTPSPARASQFFLATE